MDQKPPLTGTLQENILVLLAHNDQHGKVIANIVDTNLFQGDYQVIAERCVDYWRQYNQAPKAHTPDLLTDIIEDAEQKGRAQTLRRVLLNMLQLSEGINADYILSEYKNFARAQKMIDAVFRSADKFEALQEKGIRDVEEIWDEMLRVRETSYDPGLGLNDVDHLLDWLNTHFAEFTTGIPELDKYQIVPARGSTFLMLAAAKAGKCIAEGELVALADGSLLPIQQVPDGAKVVSYNENSKCFEPQTATLKFNGVKNTVKVTTRTGRSITLTENHPLLAKRGWVYAGDIIAGETIAVPCNDRQGDIFYDEVVSIEPIGPIKTYDLSVTNTHNFVCGNTIVHNSWFLTHLGKQALLARKKVLHLTLEMSSEECLMRYYRALFMAPKRNAEVIKKTLEIDDFGKLAGFATENVKYDFSFQSSSIRDELSVRLDWLGKRANNLKIVRYPPRSLTPAALRAYLDQCEIIDRFIPDMIVLDYIGIVKTDSKNHRISLGRAFEEFRAIGIERHVAFVTAHQLSKIGATAKMADSTQIAEDWSMVATADTILTYSQTKAEARYGFGRLFVSNNRSDRDKFGLLITQNLDLGQFVLESHPLSAKYYSYLEGLGDGETTESSEEDNTEAEEDS